LFAKALDGGPERQVLDDVYAVAFVAFEDGIYYIGQPGADNRFPLQFYEFSTGAKRLLTKIEGKAYQGLGVSPDRKSFLFSKLADSGVDLMLIENFR
jgi:hypothetical protein